MTGVVLLILCFQDWKRILIREPFWVNLKLSNSVTLLWSTLRLMCNFAKIGAIQLIVVKVFLPMVKERNVKSVKANS